MHPLIVKSFSHDQGHNQAKEGREGESFPIPTQKLDEKKKRNLSYRMKRVYYNIFA